MPYRCLDGLHVSDSVPGGESGRFRMNYRVPSVISLVKTATTATIVFLSFFLLEPR